MERTKPKCLKCKFVRTAAIKRKPKHKFNVVVKVFAVNHWYCSNPNLERSLEERIIDVALIADWCPLTEKEKYLLTNEKKPVEELIKELGY